MEYFVIPAVGAIIEKIIDGKKTVLIQKRNKQSCEKDNGLLEIPAGKVREYESIFDALRREVKEETNLDIEEIYGENKSRFNKTGEYNTMSFSSFCITQNLQGGYSIMLHTFLCKASGKLAYSTNETIELQWMPVSTLSKILSENKEYIYPMHINALNKYLRYLNV